MPRKQHISFIETVADEDDKNDIRISWSQLRTASECRQKAYWQRKVKSGPDTDNRVFFPGSVCDRLLRNWLHDDDRDSWNMVDRVEETIESEQELLKEKEQGYVKWKDASDKAKVIATCKQAIKQLVPLLETYILPYDFEPSKWFTTSINMRGLDGQSKSVKLVGEMDILVQDPATGQFAIWDLKITRDKNYYKKTIMQLAFYDIALFCEFGTPSSTAGLLMPLLETPVVKLKIDQQIRREMLMRMQNYATMRWRGDIEPKKEFAGCKWCPVASYCDKMKARTLF